MPTGRDFHAQTNLPLRADVVLVNRLITDLMLRLDSEVRRDRFIPDWSGMTIETQANVYESQSITDTAPIIIGTTTTIRVCVRGVKDDEND